MKLATYTININKNSTESSSFTILCYEKNKNNMGSSSSAVLCCEKNNDNIVKPDPSYEKINNIKEYFSLNKNSDYILELDYRDSFKYYFNSIYKKFIDSKSVKISLYLKNFSKKQYIGYCGLSADCCISPEIDNQKYREDRLDKQYEYYFKHKNIIDKNIFNNIHALNLSSCNYIIDVSMLGSIHTLDLSNCKKIVDVSNLGSVHALSLDSCINVKDISMLTKTKILNLSNMPKIKDVGHLKNLEKLFVNTKMYGIHLLSNLQTLQILFNKKINIKIYDSIKKLKKINKYLEIIDNSQEFRYLHVSIHVPILHNSKKKRRRSRTKRHYKSIPCPVNYSKTF